MQIHRFMMGLLILPMLAHGHRLPSTGSAEQTFEAAIGVMCDSPTLCVQCRSKTGFERQAALADFIGDHATNPEFVALFEKMSQVSLTEGQALLTAAMVRAKVAPCEFIEDAKTWVDPLLAPATPKSKSVDAVPAELVNKPKSPGSTRSIKAVLHPAAVVSDAILTAIAAQDTAGIERHFNATNRKKIKPSDIPRLLSETLKETKGVRRTDEIRKAPRFMGPHAVLAKIRVEGSEVLVLVLTFEDEQYRFEDINTPNSSQFIAQPLIWKRP